MSKSIPENYVFEIVKCHYCGKEFLVERYLMGIDHTLGTLVTCKECARKAIEEQHDFIVRFRKQHPEAYKVIEEWATK